MPRGVRTDPLLPAGQCFHGAGEVFGSVVGTVVGDYPVDAGDPVGDEERPCAAEEPDRGGCILIIEGLGVSQAGETVHGRVQVGVPPTPAGAAFGGPPGRRIASVDPPATTVGDLPELLHIQVDQVPGEGRGDRCRVAVVLPAGVQVFASGDPQPVQPARDRPDRAGVPWMASSRGIMRADHLFSRRQVSISSNTSTGSRVVGALE